MTPKAISMKERNDKVDCITIKNFCSAKYAVKRRKRAATGLEKIFAKELSDRGLLSKIHKEPLTLNNKGRLGVSVIETAGS